MEEPSVTKAVGEQLEALLRLQEVDGEIYRLNREKQAKPVLLQETRRALETKRRRLEEVERGLKDLEVARKNKEIDLETKEGLIKKYQIQLYQVKTNKEYTSLQHEIGGLKADKSLLEETILRLMDLIDEKKKEVATIKEGVTELTQTYRQEEERVRREVEALDSEIAQLQERRRLLVPEIEPKLLVRYERVLVGREGEGMAPIDETSCLGCHMQLPPQVINEVRLREKIVSCENCSRILYVKDP